MIINPHKEATMGIISALCLYLLLFIVIHYLYFQLIWQAMKRCVFKYVHVIFMFCHATHLIFMLC